jgi:hypothetical protein
MASAILMIFVYVHPDGVVVREIPFTSMDACVVARAAILAKADMRWRYNITCVQS